MGTKINRRIALSGVTMGLATISSYLFPPLLIPTMVLGIYVMLPLYQRTFKHLIQERKVKLDLLASLYLTGFWLAGYYIFASFALMIYFFGVKVVYHMEGRSRENITNLFGQQPRLVWQVVNGVEVQTPLRVLQVGDVVVVNAGEPLPVDGVIIEGLGLVDQHLLTGESQPVEKSVGDRVFASTLLLSGRLFVQVETTGQNTLTAKIAEILNQTTSYQTEAELKGQQLADQTVLPNLAVSLLALPVVGLQGSVAVLGAGLGFNLRLISLLSVMNYLTIASRHNILIKDGRALERLREVDTIVFDKTGTLTLEQPHVTQLHVVQAGLSEVDLLIYAATAEYRQPHPIAKAIISAAEEQGLELPEIEEANYEVGYGIKVRVKGQLIRVGSSRFITQEGLTIPPQIETRQATGQAQGFTLVLVAINEQVAGAIELHTTIRPEAQRIIQKLRKRNLSLAIISGDQLEPTRELASELGIENYFANTLPENKANLIKQLQEEGRVVCFIGDGINDAIALKQADVSISLRGATTIATDTAQVVLMDQSLNQLDYLLALAHQFDNTLRTGFITTIVPGVICIGGVFVAGFGIYAAEILFQLGFFSGLGLAMRPLLNEAIVEPVEY
ncbi:MAG: heavy metal translocating P-type ATPase [Thioploca sp.]|nr:heavy metal translocating P-type ATPase [Thioploca sp.]